MYIDASGATPFLCLPRKAVEIVDRIAGGEHARQAYPGARNAPLAPIGPRPARSALRMVCTRYVPRQPRASPVWQILYDHAAEIPGLSTATAAAIGAFLDCGDLHAGFTRLRSN